MELVKTFTVTITVDLTCPEQVREAIEFLTNHLNHYQVDLQSFPADPYGERGKVILIKAIRRYLTLQGKPSSLKISKILADKMMGEITFGLSWLKVIEVMKNLGHLSDKTKDVFIECIEKEHKAHKI